MRDYIAMSDANTHKLLIIRASLRSYISLTFFQIILLMGGLWVALKKPASDIWPVVGLLICSILLTIFVISRFRIILSSDSISYRSCFGGTKSITLSEIKKAKIQIGGISDNLEGFYRLVIIPHPNSEKKSIVINMGIFGVRDMAKVFDFLGTKLVGRRGSYPRSLKTKKKECQDG